MIVDYHSRYFDAIELKSTTTSAVVSAMKATFSCHGIQINLMGLYLIHESSVCFATNMVYNTLLQARISKVPLEELKERYRLSRGYGETLIKRISAC